MDDTNRIALISYFHTVLIYRYRFKFSFRPHTFQRSK